MYIKLKVEGNLLKALKKDAEDSVELAHNKQSIY